MYCMYILNSTHLKHCMLCARMTLLLSLSGGRLQAETEGSKVNSAGPVHAVNNNNKEEETREAQVGDLVHFGWCHTCSHAYTHVCGHTHVVSRASPYPPCYGFVQQQ